MKKYIIIGFFITIIIGLIIIIWFSGCGDQKSNIFSNKGRLQLETSPNNAIIYLRKKDEKYTDKTYQSTLEIELEPGTYYYYALKEGYISSGEMSFVIIKGKDTNINIQLKQDPDVDIEGDLSQIEE